jgi:hypothetical protein
MNPALNLNELVLGSILRSRWDPDALDNIQPVLNSTNFSWEEFNHFLLVERLYPLVYYLLREMEWTSDSFKENSEKAFLSTTTQNLLLFKELEEILKLVNSKQIDVILLKGAALATQIYPHIAMRPMEDLDILVKPGDASTMISVLEEIGYHKTRQEEHPGFTLNYENEIGLIKQDSVLKLVEVHWSLFNSSYYQNKIPQDVLWSAARPIKFNRTPTLMLGPEIQFLHLCGHLSLHHAGKGWLWRHDLAEILMHATYHLDWERLLASAQNYDLVIPLRTHLTEVVDIYKINIPIQVLSKLTDLTPSPFERHFFSTSSSPSAAPGKTFLNDFRNIPGLRSKVHFALANLFPSSMYMKYRYKVKSPFLLPFYYIYRWYLGTVDLLKHH